jgi:hypothetical protein
VFEGISDLDITDHLPLQAVFRCQGFYSDIKIANAPKPLPMHLFPKVSEHDANHIAIDVFEPFRKDLEDALANNDTTRAHSVWCKVAVAYLLKMLGMDKTGDPRSVPLRGELPVFRSVRNATKFASQYGATSAKTRNLIALRKPCSEYVVVLTRHDQTQRCLIALRLNLIGFY